MGLQTGLVLQNVVGLHFFFILQTGVSLFGLAVWCWLMWACIYFLASVGFQTGEVLCFLAERCGLVCSFSLVLACVDLQTGVGLQNGLFLENGVGLQTSVGLENRLVLQTGEGFQFGFYFADWYGLVWVLQYCVRLCGLADW